MKNSNGTIGNRTRDLPACSAVPQPTAPPGASYLHKYLLIVLTRCAKFIIYINLLYFSYMIQCHMHHHHNATYLKADIVIKLLNIVAISVIL